MVSRATHRLIDVNTNSHCETYFIHDQTNHVSSSMNTVLDATEGIYYIKNTHSKGYYTGPFIHVCMSMMFGNITVCI